MAKIRQHLEKVERNKEYAEKFKDKKKEKEKSKKKKTPTYANWCRIAGHPSSCQCVYPLRSEIPVGGRR